MKDRLTREFARRVCPGPPSPRLQEPKIFKHSEPCNTTIQITYSPVDLVVLLDGSNSIDASEFRLELQSAVTFLHALDEFLPNSFKAGVAQFSSTVQTEAVLSSDIYNAEQNITWNARQLGGGTYFGPALSRCAKLIDQRGQNNSYKMCTLISDGYNNDPTNLATRFPEVQEFCSSRLLFGRNCTAMRIADALKAENYKITGIFVGNDVQDRDNLARFSSCGKKESAIKDCDFYAHVAEWQSGRLTAPPDNATRAVHHFNCVCIHRTLCDFSDLRKKAASIANNFQDDFQFSNKTICPEGSVQVKQDLEPEFLIMAAPFILFTCGVLCGLLRVYVHGRHSEGQMSLIN